MITQKDYAVIVKKVQIPRQLTNIKMQHKNQNSFPIKQPTYLQQNLRITYFYMIPTLRIHLFLNLNKEVDMTESQDKIAI